MTLITCIKSCCRFLNHINVRLTRDFTSVAFRNLEKIPRNMSKRKFFIDCDVGADDAQAILMALAYDDIDVVGISTVFGNGDLHFTAHNTLRVLQVAGRLDIPVYKGCQHSLLGVPSFNDGFHGDDALGDHPGYQLSSDREALYQKQHAVLGLLDAANKYSGELTLVCTGPLTNIATAIMLDADFGKKLKHCYIMGGNITGRGNVTVAQEFNFYSDQEAAYSTLNNLKSPITLVDHEIVYKYAPSWDWYDTFVNQQTHLAKFVKEVEKKMTDRDRKKGDKSYVCLWDQLAMAVAIDNKIATKTTDVYATVELHGSITRGQMVVDWNGKFKKDPNVRLVLEIDQQGFYKMLYKGIGCEL